MKIVYAGLALALSLILSADADAYVFGGSNLGFMGYPDPTCTKPMKPYDLSDKFAVDEYNNELETYIQCIKEYLENEITTENGLRKRKMR